MEWKIAAVGTDHGRAVLFLINERMQERIVPTDVISMSALAADGVRVRNVNTPSKRK